MTKQQIEKVAEDLGWKTWYGEQFNHYAFRQETVVEFEKYTSFGQDVMVSAVVDSLDDVPQAVQDYYEGYDVDEEAALWIGPDGHGMNGAPYHLSDLIDDMKEAKEMIEELAIALGQV